MRTYINRYAALPGQRAIVMTNNDDAYRTGIALHDNGARVTIVDLRSKPSGALIRAATDAGIEILFGHAVIAAHGNHRVARVEIAPIDDTVTSIAGDIIHRDCDAIAMSGGLSPAVHLHSRHAVNYNGMTKTLFQTINYT